MIIVDIVVFENKLVDIYRYGCIPMPYFHPLQLVHSVRPNSDTVDLASVRLYSDNVMSRCQTRRHGLLGVLTLTSTLTLFV